MTRSYDDWLDHLSVTINGLRDEVSRREVARVHSMSNRPWAAIEPIGRIHVEGQQRTLMGSLPLAVARRRARPSLNWWEAGMPSLPMLVSLPPGVEGPAEHQDAVAQIQQRWKTSDDQEYWWATYRMCLGADGGIALRQRCWSSEDGRDVLSAEVVDLSAEPPGPLTQELEGWNAEDQEAIQAAVNAVAESVFMALALGPPAPAREARRAASALEVAVLMDPEEDPPWLSEHAYEALLADPPWANTSPGRGNLSARKIVATRLLWRSAYTSRAALQCRQQLYDEYSAVSLMLATMGICEPWPKGDRVRHGAETEI